MLSDILQINPFPGLRPFEEDEDYLFFGREKQIDELLYKLRTVRFLSVMGTSGSGKSSLVKAGLIPSLRRGYMVKAGSSWKIASFRPGSDPIGNLAKALSEPGLLHNNPEWGEMNKTMTYVTLKRSKYGLINVFKESKLPYYQNFLIIVDQFEELFRFRRIERGNAQSGLLQSVSLINLLLEAALQEVIPIYIVITMRSDFLGDCMEFEGLPEAINKGQYLVPRMTREEIEEAIKGPMAVGEANLSNTLINRLLNDIEDKPEQLPVLQHALMRTYEKWIAEEAKEAPVALKHYEAIGAMEDALSRHAEEAYAELKTDNERHICELIFKALTDKSSDPRGIRRPVKLSDLTEVTGATEDEVKEVIQIFRQPERAFLMPPISTELESNTVIDISHESLMRTWDRLIGWTDEEAQAAEVYLRLSEAMLLYEEGKAGLWRNPELEIGLQWLKVHHPTESWAKRYNNLFPYAIEFLNESKKQYLRELEEKEKERKAKMRRTRNFALLVSIAAVISIILSIITFNSREKAKGEARRANANYKKARVGNLTLLADKTTENDPTLALRLAEEALKLDSNEALTELIENIYYGNFFYKTIAQHDGITWDAVFSPDQKYILTASDDRTARLWDLEGNNLQTFKGHTGRVYKVRFSPDGQLILTGSGDHTAKLWDLEGNNVQTLKRHANEVQAVAFSPDGDYILTGSSDSTAVLWDLQGKPLQVFKGHEGAVLSVCFSPDGKQVLTSSVDKTARLWSLEGKEVQVFRGHEYHVYKALFSSDNQFILTGANDYTVRMWDLKGNTLQVFRGHDAILHDMTLSSDGQFILASFSDKVYLWNREGVILHVFKGHKMQVESVCFSPDDQFMLTSSSDRTAALWDLRALPNILEGHEKGIYGVAFSPDQRFVFTCADDYTVRMWNLQGKQLKVFKGHSSYVNAIDVSSDGKYILTGSTDRTARLWDLEGNTLQVFRGHEGDILEVTFSPDGKYILTGSEDRTARLWDLSGNILQVFGTVTFSPDNEFQIRSVAFSPDGKLVLIDDKNTARLWDLEGNILQVFRGHKGRVRAAVFLPDGQHILTGSEDRTARLWDLEGNTLRSFVGHEDRILSIAVSSDGKTVVTGSSDRTARLWDIEGNMLQTFKGHEGDIWGVDFSPDNQLVITGSGDKTARIWKQRMPLRQFLEEGTLKKLSVADKLQYEFLSYEDITDSKSIDTLLESARYYVLKANEVSQKNLKLSYLNKGILFYERLLAIETEVKYYTELSDALLDQENLLENTRQIQKKQEQILKALLKLTEKRALLLGVDFYNNKALEFTDFEKKRIWLKRALVLSQKTFELFPDDQKAKSVIATAYNGLARHYLFNKAFKEAVVTAQEGFAIQQDWTGATLILAWLYDGQYEKAKEIYRSIQEKHPDNQAIKGQIMIDIEELKSEDITHHDVEKLVKFLFSGS